MHISGGIGNQPGRPNGKLPVLVPGLQAELQDDQTITDDFAVVGSVTSLVGSYLAETFVIHTTDYNWNPWSTSYTFDNSLQPAYGCVGAFDDDTGRLA